METESVAEISKKDQLHTLSVQSLVTLQDTVRLQQTASDISMKIMHLEWQKQNVQRVHHKNCFLKSTCNLNKKENSSRESSGEQPDNFSLFNQPIGGVTSNNCKGDVNQSLDQLDPSDLELQSLNSNRILQKSDFIFVTNIDQETQRNFFCEKKISQLNQSVTKMKEASSIQPAQSQRNKLNFKVLPSGQKLDAKENGLEMSERSKVENFNIFGIESGSSSSNNQTDRMRVPHFLDDENNDQISHEKNLRISKSSSRKKKIVQADQKVEEKLTNHSDNFGGIPTNSNSTQPRLSGSNQSIIQQNVQELTGSRSNQSGSSDPNHIHTSHPVSTVSEEGMVQNSAKKRNDQISTTLRIQQNKLLTDQNSMFQQSNAMAALKQKLHINLNIPSMSGGSFSSNYSHPQSFSNNERSDRPNYLQQAQAMIGENYWNFSPQKQIQTSPHLTPGQIAASDSNGTTSNRTGPQLSEHSLRGTQQTLINNNGLDQIPANLSQDPHFYLHWRQQKHKSSRSAYPNHQEYLINQKKGLNAGNARTLRNRDTKLNKNQANEIASLESSSSQRAIPLLSLKEVKNPSSLITFCFVNRKATHLNEIDRFRNLTELDVNGNHLVQEVKELLKLPFLKKLNLANNQISTLWALPHTLEILNLSQNNLKQLNTGVMIQLCNLVTLEVASNCLENLDGLQNLPRLKRFIANNNKIQTLEPLQNLKALIEIDLESNPIDSYQQVLLVILEKKDILVFNLKNSPMLQGTDSYEEFFNKASLTIMEQLLKKNELNLKNIDEFKKLLGFLANGIFYRSKRTFSKIRQYMAQCETKCISSYVSNGSSSENRKGLSPLQTLTAQGSRHKDIKAQVAYPMHTYETLEILYDKLLEDEDKILLLHKKRQNKIYCRKKQEEKKKKQLGLEERRNDSYSEKTGSCEDVSDLDDVSSDILDDSLSDQDFELNELKETYKNEKQAAGDGRDFLNESTADFNKAIKQINLQLQIESHLDQNGLALSHEKEKFKIMSSHKKKIESQNSNCRSKREQNDLLNNEINVAIPKEEKVLSKQISNIQVINLSPDVQRQSKIGQLSVQKKLPNFKLDLSKCQQEQASVLIHAKSSQDFSELIGKDPVQQEDLVKETLQSPTKNNVEVQKSPQLIKIQQSNVSMIVKKQVQPQVQFTTQTKHQKQIIIPRLALQDIQRQTSECSSLTKPDQQNLKTKADVPSFSVQKQPLKNFRVLSSKRDSATENSGTEMTKEVMAEREIEMVELKKIFEQHKQIIEQIKLVLCNQFMKDSEIISQITQMKEKNHLQEE